MFYRENAKPAHDCTISRYTIIRKTKHQGFKLALAPHSLSEFVFCMRQHPAWDLKAQLCLGLHFCLSKVAPR